jgi:hypothetical protein
LHAVSHWLAICACFLPAPAPHDALTRECYVTIVQFACVPALRDALQQRDLQAQLHAADQGDKYQLAVELEDKLGVLQEKIAQLPLSEEDYLTLGDRYATLVQMVSLQCRALFTAKDRVALAPLAAMLEELKALDLRTRTIPCETRAHVGSPIPGTDNNSPAHADPSVSGFTGYASNGVPITNVQDLRSAQPGLAAASLR